MPTLHTGLEVATDSDDWRLECLAMHLLRTCTTDELVAYLQEAEAKGGRRLAGLRERLNSIKATQRAQRQAGTGCKHPNKVQQHLANGYRAHCPDCKHTEETYWD